MRYGGVGTVGGFSSVNGIFAAGVGIRNRKFDGGFCDVALQRDSQLRRSLVHQNRSFVTVK